MPREEWCASGLYVCFVNHSGESLHGISESEENHALEKNLDTADACNFDALVGTPTRTSIRVLYRAQMGLLCILSLSRDPRMESIKMGMDSGLCADSHRLQSDP